MNYDEMQLEAEPETETCNVCGGDIPPAQDWVRFGETNEGYCNGCVRPDGICGAFGDLD